MFMAFSSQSTTSVRLGFSAIFAVGVLDPVLRVSFCAAPQVLAVRFTNLRYFFPQLCDALFDGPRHRDRVAEHVARTTVANSVFAPTSQTSSFYPAVQRPLRHIMSVFIAVTC